MRGLLRRGSRPAAWVLSVALAAFVVVNCVPITAEESCPCCASEALQLVSDFTVAKTVSAPAPSTTFVVLPTPVGELSSPSDARFLDALHRSSGLKPSGVPLYLLDATLLI